jgi:hypothetical protein
LPLLFFVKWTEEGEFDNDPSPARIPDQIFQSIKVGGIPPAQIEFVASFGIAGNIAPRPRTNETVLGGRQRVAADVERALRLDVSAGENPGVIQAIGVQRVEILPVIEIKIQQRAIMFGRCDQHGGLPSKEKIMRILWMKRDRLCCMRKKGKQEKNEAGEQMPGEEASIPARFEIPEFVPVMAGDLVGVLNVSHHKRSWFCARLCQERENVNRFQRAATFADFSRVKPV